MIECGELDRAEEAADRWIGDDTACDDNNDVVFMAAIAVCRKKGDREKEESLTNRLKIYEKEVENLLTGAVSFNDEEDDEWF